MGLSRESAEWNLLRKKKQSNRWQIRVRATPTEHRGKNLKTQLKDTHTHMHTHIYIIVTNSFWRKTHKLSTLKKSKYLLMLLYFEGRYHVNAFLKYVLRLYFFVPRLDKHIT